MIESGMKNTEIAQEMRERYLVSAKKTALAITIANRERALLQDIDYEAWLQLICRYSLLSKYLFVLFLQLLPFEALGKKSR